MEALPNVIGILSWDPLGQLLYASAYIDPWTIIMLRSHAEGDKGHALLR